MTTNAAAHPRTRRTKAVVAVAAILGLALLLLYMQGTIGGRKVQPGEVPLSANEMVRAGARVVPVERRVVEDVLDWPGTVSSRLVANVAPRVMARVLEVFVSAGATVQAGDPLMRLDDRELRARSEQARAALAAAEAQARQAEADDRRTRALFAKQAATQQDLDAATARAKATGAQVAQARDAVNEVSVLLGETNVRAPFDGVVAARLVDPGDMASPGKPVAIVHDPHTVRLEVRVGEQCAAHVTVGRDLPARIDTLGQEVPTRIEEVAPMADPATRTFLVKATLPSDPALRPGTFGSLRVPCGRHSALLIPKAAVSRTGQLETVQLVVNDTVRVRHVRSGKEYGEQIEILSGLKEGARVLVGASE
jgi:RND family efflux transporter MFP subunit